MAYHVLVALALTAPATGVVQTPRAPGPCRWDRGRSFQYGAGKGRDDWVMRCEAQGRALTFEQKSETK